jgi:hypothetical protein
MSVIIVKRVSGTGRLNLKLTRKLLSETHMLLLAVSFHYGEGGRLVGEAFLDEVKDDIALSVLDVLAGIPNYPACFWNDTHSS